MLKNRDSIFKQITSENEEETTKYIEQYIAEDEKISDVAKKVRDLMKKTKEDETRLDKRERVLSGNNFENRQQEMIKQIQNE
jgi:peptide subunit release factor 1 (eRF1)